jgi:hypothetical protein
MCELMAKMCDVIAAANGRGIVHGVLARSSSGKYFFDFV